MVGEQDVIGKITRIAANPVDRLRYCIHCS